MTIPPAHSVGLSQTAVDTCPFSYSRKTLLFSPSILWLTAHFRLTINDPIYTHAGVREKYIVGTACCRLLCKSASFAFPRAISNLESEIKVIEKQYDICNETMAQASETEKLRGFNIDRGY